MGEYLQEFSIMTSGFLCKYNKKPIKILENEGIKIY